MLFPSSASASADGAILLVISAKYRPEVAHIVFEFIQKKSIEWRCIDEVVETNSRRK